jgi:hypothetical protein
MFCSAQDGRCYVGGHEKHVIGYIPARYVSSQSTVHPSNLTFHPNINVMPVPTWPFYALIPASILLHLVVSPYTKVEESFNIQAIHDILVHGVPTENADQFLTANYDHVSFPGSVPRTFAGALVLTGLSRPFVGLTNVGEEMQMIGMRCRNINDINTNTNAVYSERSYWSSKCCCAYCIRAKRAAGFWNKCWHLVRVAPSKPVSCHILCISNTSKYVCSCFQ